MRRNINNSTISGYFLNQNSNRSQIIPYQPKSIDDMKECISYFISFAGGVLIFGSEDEFNINCNELYLYYDNGLYMPEFREFINGNVELRHLNNKSKGISFILGEPYDNSLISKDYYEIIELFSLFFKEGRIEHSIMK